MAGLTGFFGSSNFGQSMELSEYMEGYPEGFDIRSEDIPFHEKTGELIGYRVTEERKETEKEYWNQLAREELETTFLEQINGVEPPQEIELPIAFGIFRWALENGYTFEASFEMASEVYEENWREYDAQVEIVSNLIRELHQNQTGDSDHGRFLWLVEKLLSGLPRQPEPVVLVREPVIDDMATQADESTTLCQLFDSLDWQYRMDNIRVARQPEHCFRDNGSKVLSHEEMTYLSRKKTEREEREARILAWLNRARPEAIKRAFIGPDAPFWKQLSESRSECLGKSGTGLKTLAELILTKAQVDTIWATAKARLGWKGRK